MLPARMQLSKRLRKIHRMVFWISLFIVYSPSKAYINDLTGGESTGIFVVTNERRRKSKLRRVSKLFKSNKLRILAMARNFSFSFFL